MKKKVITTIYLNLYSSILKNKIEDNVIHNDKLL